VDKALHFDIESLDMLVQLMENDFPELVNVFVVDSEPKILALKQAVAVKDFDSLREISHSFKGASGNLSALALSDLCFKIEKLSSEGEHAGIEEVIAQVEQEYRAVKAILQSMV
jgi:HPt (histidine-containing phosphotransfer) domain-containing protein